MHKLHSFKVKVPVQAGGSSQGKKVKGYRLFPEPYSNIFLCARKKSGKTNVIYNILEQCIDKRTTCLFFASAHHKDKAYNAIFKMLDKRRISYLKYDHFITDGVNQLDELISTLQGIENDKANGQEEECEGPICEMLHIGEPPKPKPKKEKKKKESKIVVPELCLIFDDLSEDLRHKSIARIFKSNRHWKMMTICSSQYLHDLTPQAIRNLDYLLMFRSFDKDKVEHIYKLLRPAVTFESFLKMYDRATKDPYNFFYVDVTNEEYRKNFNYRLNIK